jgi:hypothetical protein
MNQAAIVKLNISFTKFLNISHFIIEKIHNLAKSLKDEWSKHETYPKEKIENKEPKPIKLKEFISSGNIISKIVSDIVADEHSISYLNKTKITINQTRKLMKYLVFIYPTQLPSHTQWWSLRRTHFSQVAQWLDLSNFIILQNSQFCPKCDCSKSFKTLFSEEFKILSLFSWYGEVEAANIYVQYTMIRIRIDKTVFDLRSNSESNTYCIYLIKSLYLLLCWKAHTKWGKTM